MRSSNYSSKNQPNKFWLFIRKWGIWIALGIVILPWLIKYAISMISSIKKTANQAVIDTTYNQNITSFTTQQEHADAITARKDIQAAAKGLVHALGIDGLVIDWNWLELYNLSGMTEDDAEAARLILWQRNNLRQVERLYNEVYTRGHILHDDILRLLDADQLQRIRQYINY